MTHTFSARSKRIILNYNRDLQLSNPIDSIAAKSRYQRQRNCVEKHIHLGNETRNTDHLCALFHTSNHELLVVALGLAFYPLDEVLFNDPLECLADSTHELWIPVATDDTLHK